MGNLGRLEHYGSADENRVRSAEMRVAWVAHTSDHMGAERVMIEAVKGIGSLGVDCHVVLPWKSHVARAWDDLDVPRTTAPVAWWSYPGPLGPIRRALIIARVAKSTAILLRRLRQIRPDLVITNTSVTPAAAFASKLLGIRHVWYIHEFGREDHGLHFALGRSLSLRAIAWLSDRVIVNSRAVGAHYADILPEAKTRLLHCGVEAPKFRELPRQGIESFKLVIVGRLSPGKRQEDAIRAVAILQKKRLASHLTIVGPVDGTCVAYAAYLKQLAVELGVATTISFVGEMESPFPYFAAAQLSLTCSRREAFGRVTVEAMKVGVPVIGARGGGTVDLIKDGFNGFLYSPCDPVDLARKIEIVMRDPALRRAMGVNAQRWATEMFDVKKYAAGLLSILHEAMDGKAAPGVTPGAR